MPVLSPVTSASASVWKIVTLPDGSIIYKMMVVETSSNTDDLIYDAPLENPSYNVDDVEGEEDTQAQKVPYGKILPRSLTYLYANESPVNMSDPSGKSTLIEVAVTISVVATLGALALPHFSSLAGILTHDESVQSAGEAAIPLAKNMVINAINLLQAKDPSAEIWWFGQDGFSEKGNSTLIDYYGDILSALQKPITFYKTNESSFAHVSYYWKDHIWLDKLYFTAPLSWTQDSKPGVLIHEISHYAVGTSDYVYGPKGCKQLAQDYGIGLTSDNADNYEYFAEGVR